MGLLQRLEQRTYQLLGHPRDPGLIDWLGGGAASISGATVTPDTSFGVMSVYRSVRLIANTLATLPFGVYELLEDGSRKLARKHPLSALLRRRPNRWQTAFGWKQMMAGHLELRGNAYSEIFADGRGRVTDLIPLHPDRVTPRSEILSPEIGEVVWYEYRPVNKPMRIILWDEMLHVRGFSQDGLVGLSPITIAREAIGLALSNREYAARYLANNATPGGALIHPGPLSELAKKNIRKSWEEKHGQVRNVGRVAILEEDMKWQSIGFNPKDSQFLDQRRFDNEEIARMFDLPPHMLMDLDRSTNNNIEQQAMEFVSYCILPRSVNMEETYERDLLLPSDEDRYFVEANLEGLLRGDSTARGEWYTKMFSIGAYSPNDIRKKENENPVDGGEERFIPLNMVPLRMAVQLLEDQSKVNPTGTPLPDDPAAKGAPLPADPAATSARMRLLEQRVARAHERLFVDALGRVLRKEALAGRRALDKAAAARSIVPVTAWLDAFYGIEHESFASRAITPAVVTMGETFASAMWGDDDVVGLDVFLTSRASDAAGAHVRESRNELRRILKDSTAEERAEQLGAAFTDWETRRAARDGAAVAAAMSAVMGDFLLRAARFSRVLPPDQRPLLHPSRDSDDEDTSDA